MVSVVAYHGTGEDVSPGVLEIGHGDPGEPSSVGLWFSEDRRDAFDYARQGGLIHEVQILAPARGCAYYDEWGALKEEIEELGGPESAREHFLQQGICAIEIDRGEACPREWIILDEDLISPIVVDEVISARGPSRETRRVWSASEPLPAPLSPPSEADHLSAKAPSFSRRKLRLPGDSFSDLLHPSGCR